MAFAGPLGTTTLSYSALISRQHALGAHFSALQLSAARKQSSPFLHSGRGGRLTSLLLAR